MISSIAAIASLVAGFALKGPPLSPDHHVSGLRIAGTLLVFAFFAVSTLAWGRVAARAFGFSSRLDQRLLSPALGAVWVGFSAGVAGHLGLIGYGAWAGIPIGFLLLGCLLDDRRRVSPDTSDAVPFRPFEGLLGLAIFAMFARSSLLNGTTDPLTYHLVGPRLFTDAGRIYVSPSYPEAFHVDLFEYLFIFGNELLGGERGAGLIEGQYFGQWSHLVFGMGGVLAALTLLGLKAGFSGLASTAAAVLAGASHELLLVSTLAKNDLAVAAWFIAGTVVHTIAKTPWQRLLAGFLLGAALAEKLTVGFSVVCVAALAVHGGLRRRDPGGVALTATGVLLGAAECWLRNGFWTGDPFFPAFFRMFSADEWLSPTNQWVFGKAAGGALGFAPISVVTERIQQWLGDHWLNWFAPVLILLALGRRRRPTSFGAFPGARFHLAWAVPSLLLVVVKQFGVIYMLRWAAPALVVVAFLTCLALIQALEPLCARVTSRIPWTRFAITTLSLALVFWPHRHWAKAYATWLDGPDPELVIRDPLIHPGGDSRAWIRLNLPPDARIVSTGDSLTYYLLTHDLTVARQQPALDRAIHTYMDPRSILDVLVAYRFEYALDVAHWNAGSNWGVLPTQLGRLVAQAPEAVVHAGPKSAVVAIQALYESVHAACVDYSSETAPTPLWMISRIATVDELYDTSVGL